MLETLLIAAAVVGVIVAYAYAVTLLGDSERP